AYSGSEYVGLKDPSRMSDEDISDDDVEALLAKFFRNYQGVPVIPAALRQYESWYEPEVVSFFLLTCSSLTLGFLLLTPICCLEVPSI
ncbi:hypothetical protein, partial [Escherichia coli]|uniref:hypothetical protein n=1 Tax=Escherichia coli TaxID=562 RepID=UPI001CA6F413